MATTTNKKPQAKPKVQNTMKGKSVGRRIADSLRGVVAAIAGRPLMSALGFMAILLLVLFFIGISILTPRSPGTEISFSQAENLIATPNGVQQATLLDQDARLQLVTPTGQQLWTAYPTSNAYTSQLLTLLNKYKVSTVVNGQPGKVPLRFVVQFLLPILILVTGGTD